MLRRAVGSVMAQTFVPAAVAVAVDRDGIGAAETRQGALTMVQTEWVAFLDDDDQMLPQHLETLMRAALETGADYVYSWFTDDHVDPLGHFGKPFDPDNPTQTTITTLVRTDLAQEVGFRAPPPGELIHGQPYGEDFQFTLGCLEMGAEILHVPERTWIWNWHGNNTSGLPWRSR
jgi:glycosyl transferase family 2